MDSESAKEVNRLILKSKIDALKSINLEEIKAKIDLESLKIIDETGIRINKKTMKFLMLYTNAITIDVCGEILGQIESSLEEN